MRSPGAIRLLARHGAVQHVHRVHVHHGRVRPEREHRGAVEQRAQRPHVGHAPGPQVALGAAGSSVMCGGCTAATTCNSARRSRSSGRKFSRCSRQLRRPSGSGHWPNFARASSKMSSAAWMKPRRRWCGCAREALLGGSQHSRSASRRRPPWVGRSRLRRARSRRARSPRPCAGSTRRRRTA